MGDKGGLTALKAAFSFSLGGTDEGLSSVDDSSSGGCKAEGGGRAEEAGAVWRSGGRQQVPVGPLGPRGPPLWAQRRPVVVVGN